MVDRMETRRYEFVLEANSPIAHHEGSIGNHAMIMRRKTRQPDGSWAMVPIITADTMRHKLREAASMAILDAAGMLSMNSLSEAALRLMFAGGMITGSSGGAVKLDTYRELCDLIPSLALFGGCAENRCIPGRLNVDDAVLICNESAHQLPHHVVDWMCSFGGEIDTGRAHVEEVQRVRMDPVLNPTKRALLTTDEQVAVNTRLQLSERSSADGDPVGKQDAKCTMMPRSFERVCAGSLFYWSLQCTLLSDLDLDTFNTAVLSFLGRAVVGGKQGTGHGSLKVRWGGQQTLSRPSETPKVFDTGTLAPGIGKLLRAHIAERADRLHAFLGRVVA